MMGPTRLNADLVARSLRQRAGGNWGEALRRGRGASGVSEAREVGEVER